jgi:hypothetical protein
MSSPSCGKTLVPMLVEMFVNLFYRWRHLVFHVIAEALKTTKKTSWQASRAALLYSARAGLDGYLAQQDQVQRACKAADLVGQPTDWELWKLLVKRADDCARAVQVVRAAAPPRCR